MSLARKKSPCGISRRVPDHCMFIDECIRVYKLITGILLLGAMFLQF